MAGTSATLDLIVKLDGAEKATKGLSNMAKESGGLGKAFGTLTKVGLLGATAGIGLLVGGLGLAVKAAAAEEVGIKRLGGTLKNSIKDWDGNTAAVEKDIAAKQRLGFADDALRDSLGFLVSQTGNLTEAQNLQATAMDLAAAKGIDLEKATRLVLKADDESYAALGKLGIQIDKNATKEQALAQIRAATAGQAEAYSKTAAGAMEVIHNAFGDAVEDIGAVLLPKVTELMGGFATFISSPGFKEGLTSFIELLSNGIGKALEIIGPIIGTVVGKLGEFFGAVTSGDSEKVTAFWDGIGGPIGFIGNAITTAATEIGKFFGAVISGDGENVKAYFNDVFGEGSILAGIAGFFVNAWTEATKFFDLITAGPVGATENVKVHSEAWNDLYANNQAAELKTESFWDGFWREQGEGLGELDRLYKESADKRTANEVAFALHWNTFWTDVSQGLTVWSKAWHDSDATRAENNRLFGEAWTSFWTEVGQGLETFKLAWDTFWGRVMPGAIAFQEKVAEAGPTLTKGAGDAKTAWDGFLSGVPVSVGTSFFEAGKNAGQGFINGMGAMKAGANAMAASLAAGAKAALDAGLRAKSPSEETRESGQWAGDGFILGMRDRLPEVDVAAYEIGAQVLAGFGRSMPPKSLIDLVHNAVQPGVEEVYSFFRQYMGEAHSGLQALIGMMVADSKAGVADILAEWARLNGTSSNGVPVGPDGIPNYQQSPGGVGDPTGNGGGGGGGRPVQARAWGGSITAGMPYWVGEMGRELIVPRTSGRVIPNGDLQIPERGRNYGGSLGNAANQVIQLVLDGKVIAEVLSPHLEQRRALRNAYS